MKTKKETVITLAIVFILIVGAVVFFKTNSPQETSVDSTNPNTLEDESIALIDREIRTTSDGTKYIVNPKKIRGGGPPKDGIPSIDNPKFVTVSEANEWIQDNELVLAIEYNGIERVYPLQILVFHEIVNDIIGGDPILITYCPLCGSGIAYRGEINGERVEFGTSGKLYNSNLVMYDRKTDSYWSQIDGISIVGELTGMKLEQISIDTVVWRDWKDFHPDAEVLSQKTGFRRSYGTDPYGSYYEDSFLIFPVENEDSSSVHPKTVVFGIEVNGKFKAYKESDLIAESEIIDNFNGVDLIITREEDGVVKIFREDTNEEIVKERDFWFAWYAFHPETELYNN